MLQKPLILWHCYQTKCVQPQNERGEITTARDSGHRTGKEQELAGHKLWGMIETTAGIRAHEWKRVINQRFVSELRQSINVPFISQPDLRAEPSPLAELRATRDDELAPHTKGELSVASESL